MFSTFLVESGDYWYEYIKMLVVGEVGFTRVPRDVYCALLVSYPYLWILRLSHFKCLT